MAGTSWHAQCHSREVERTILQARDAKGHVVRTSDCPDVEVGDDAGQAFSEILSAGERATQVTTSTEEAETQEAECCRLDAGERGYA